MVLVRTYIIDRLWDAGLFLKNPRFYILLIDYGRQVYYLNMTENIQLCRVAHKLQNG